MSRIKKAKKNTFKDKNGKYLCYLCGRAILKNEKANIDHIKPKSSYSNNDKQNIHGSNFNDGLGSIYNLWIELFEKNGWLYNNLILTHEKCNLEKGDKNTSRKYIEFIRKQYARINRTGADLLNSNFE